MKNLSVALVLDSAPRTWTSQEDIHLRLCQALRERGARITLVFAEEIRSDLAQRFREAGATIEVANYSHGRLRFLARLRHIVDQYEISLVHVCFFDYFSAVPWLARLSGARHILYEQLNSGEMTATSWKKQLLQLRGAVATQAAGKVIAISNFVKEQLIEAGIPSGKIVVRHLGVDTVRFCPDETAREDWARDYAIASEEIIVSTVSVLRSFKNPQTIVQACGLLAKRAVPFKLLVAGDGAMLDELQQLAIELGIAERIHWLGYCADPARLLQASDIFVLASTGEAFGLVVAEAMACGVPIVGSESGAIPEIVEDGVTGFLATARDEVSFADAIEKLARDENLRRQLGANGLARVREKFSLEIDAENTLEIYDSLFD
ncbi:MAG TPA: glycosyltransferase family 4 protein [Pyrinomonadaceae bacterium]|jgi:glycosyltransferase involved in cell wall biosynthesis|nr:glycosyltransferase family 4 protein [Pyrinomonadaceae bacterium]